MRIVKNLIVIIIMLVGIMIGATVVNLVVGWASVSLGRVLIFTAVAGFIGYWFFRIEEEN